MDERESMAVSAGAASQNKFVNLLFINSELR
jgi:hypothetical protein